MTLVSLPNNFVSNRTLMFLAAHLFSQTAFIFQIQQ